MTNRAIDQNLRFDEELEVAGAFTGVPQFVGSLTNRAVLIMFKNQSTVSVFLADNNGSTNGTTMAAGEEIIMDCRANNGISSNMGFPAGTSFFITGTGGTGAFRISSLYAY